MLALAMTAGVSVQVENKEAQAAINNIMTRTSIRQYTDEPVSKADIETMLRAGAVAKVLKLPETFIPLCTIVIGHPAEQPTPKDKWKPENVSYNEFGGKAE